MTTLPWAARALLTLVDPRVREFIGGDLEEAYVAAAAAAGRSRARQWVVRQACSAAVPQPWRPGRHNTPRGDGLMRTLLQDLVYGARTARHQPAFSSVIVLTLALAIGANAVIFSFANVLLIRPLPIRDSERIGWCTGRSAWARQSEQPVDSRVSRLP